MSIAIKRLEKAISDLPKGGMQTGSHRVKIDLSDAERLIAELNALQAECDALAAKCVSLENFCAEVATVFESMGDSSINSSRLKRIDKEMNVDAKSMLAAHDAEVAAKAVIAFGAQMMLDYKMVSEYATQLHAKAGK